MWAVKRRRREEKKRKRMKYHVAVLFEVRGCDHCDHSGAVYLPIPY